MTYMGDGPFSVADVRCKLAQVRERLAEPLDDPTCHYERQARTSLSAEAKALEALLGFIEAHATDVIRLDEGRAKRLS